jgi:hypothetical protein
MVTYEPGQGYGTVKHRDKPPQNESFTQREVQDPPPPPSDIRGGSRHLRDKILLLPPLSPLKFLYKANVHIQERPQPGDSRPVLPPSQLTLSRQIIRYWEPWKTSIGKSNNHRILQQLVFHKHQIIKATSVQNLDPRTCANNDHVSVLVHEVTAIEPGENPSRTLTWKPLTFVLHIKRRTNDVFLPLNGSRFPAPALVSPLRFSLDLLNSVHATLFLMIVLGIISRRVKLNLRFLRFTTGWFTRWGCYSVPWVIGLRYTKLHWQLAKNEVTSKSKTM